MSQAAFSEFRERYPVFTYESYSIEKKENFVHLTFRFSIDGLCTFSPETKIDLTGLTVLNAFDSPAAKRIVFSLGLVELISYWKAACPPKVVVKCGHLDEDDIKWWKRLYFGGLSEFFYNNGVETDFESFMQIECCGENPAGEAEFKKSDCNIIPVGGGKDSAVTAELLRKFGDKNKFFTVNGQKARTDTVLAAGYTEDDILKTYRTIDGNLLRLNREGFLNGHTPFSAIVAFLSFYCAYLIGGEYIVLSNEASANEPNIGGTKVNHQYSKSYAFERDFVEYAEKNMVRGIRYFSLMRPFAELQIAKQFAAFPQYHDVFRSCNRGSKQNIWCAECAKCLFVFSVLSPFIEYDRLCEIFGSDMLDNPALQADFDGLAGFSPVKPFECVGTVDEIRLALTLTAEKMEKENRPFPVLLAHFCANANGKAADRAILQSYNALHNVPEKFMPTVKEMLDYVSRDA